MLRVDTGDRRKFAPSENSEGIVCSIQCRASLMLRMSSLIRLAILWFCVIFTIHSCFSIHERKASGILPKR